MNENGVVLVIAVLLLVFGLMPERCVASINLHAVSSETKRQ